MKRFCLLFVVIAVTFMNCGGDFCLTVDYDTDNGTKNYSTDYYGTLTAAENDKEAKVNSCSAAGHWRCYGFVSSKSNSSF